jgi:hypothetical protein
MNDGMIGVFAAERGQESPVKSLDKMVAHTNGIKGPCSVQHMQKKVDDRSGQGLAVGAGWRLSNVLQGCMWLIALVGAQLCKDTCADLLESKL